MIFSQGEIAGVSDRAYSESQIQDQSQSLLLPMYECCVKVNVKDLSATELRTAVPPVKNRAF